MALSGSFNNYPVSGFGLYCEWSGVQNTNENYTDVTLTVYLRYWSINVGAKSGATISINGSSETYSTPAINHNAGTYYLRQIKTKTVRVFHNSDGTKSCTLSASWPFNGKYNGTSISTITASATVTLDPITRTSGITSASDVTLGNACNIQWTPSSSSYTYKLKFTLGSWSYTTGTISPARTSTYTYTGYTIPITVANQIPNSTSAIMSVYLYTYSGSTQVGSAAVKSFVVTVPSNVVPTINSVSAVIDNSGNSVVNSWGVAVAGYTKIRLTASASGIYNSTISSYTISGGYNTSQNAASLSYTGAAITSSGAKTFTVVAKDSRGRVSESESTDPITFYAYSAPRITAFTTSRTSGDTKRIVVNANWTYSDVGGHNDASCTLYYKKADELNWTTYGVIQKGTDVMLDGEFDESGSYNFRITVKDLLSSSASAQEEAFTSEMPVLLDFRAGGKGLGIGKIAESDNLEIALDTIFIGDIYIRVGTEDVRLDTYIKGLINAS